VIDLFGYAGITLIIVRGTIFKRFRRFWPSLLECAQCTGWWVGVIIGALAGARGITGILVAGGTSSLAALLADAILIRLLGDPDGEEQP
jgi:hypothetical protein